MVDDHTGDVHHTGAGVMADASDGERGFVYGAAKETAIDGALPPTTVNVEGVPLSPVGPTPGWVAQPSLLQRRTSSGSVRCCLLVLQRKCRGS